MTRPAVRGVAEGLRRHCGVLLMDLRGHGSSTGFCTFGDREVFDVDAAVGAARRLGYRKVVTMGWSMGGATVLRHAALAADGQPVYGHRLRHRPDAVVSVSATSRWYVRDTAPARRVLWMAESAMGRAVARRVLGVRITPEPWTTIPPAPVDVVGRIPPTPLLVVHGDRDSYFTLDHPRALARAAGDGAQLWLVPGFGHAEAGVIPGLLDRIGAHLPDLLAGREEWSQLAERADRTVSAGQLGATLARQRQPSEDQPDERQPGEGRPRKSRPNRGQPDTDWPEAATDLARDTADTVEAEG